MNIEQLEKSTHKVNLAKFKAELNALRTDARGATDTSLADYLETVSESADDDAASLTVDTLLADLGINPNMDTVENVLQVDDYNVRWIIPELIRESLRLGLRKAAIWPNLVAGEQSIAQTQIVMPFLNMSDAAPKKVNEAETIPVGSISYGSKKVEISKMGRGIQMSYEVKQYVSLNIVSIFFEDMGIKLGMALDAMLIAALVNGDQADGSESAPVIGITTPNTLVYKDLLRIWIRMSRIGRVPNTMISGEAVALEVLDLNEFKLRNQIGTTFADLKMKTPVPNSTNYYIHAAVPAHQILIVDPTYAAMKFNAQPLMIESERIINNQTLASYATLTTGFAKMFKDASLLLDETANISTAGFPSYLDIDPLEQATIS